MSRCGTVLRCALPANRCRRRRQPAGAVGAAPAQAASALRRFRNSGGRRWWSGCWPTPQVKEAYDAKLKEDPELETDQDKRVAFFQEQLQAIGGPQALFGGGGGQAGGGQAGGGAQSGAAGQAAESAPATTTAAAGAGGAGAGGGGPGGGGGFNLAQIPEERRQALITRLLENEEVKKAYEAKLEEDPSLENDETRRLEFLQEQLQAIGGPRALFGGGGGGGGGGGVAGSATDRRSGFGEEAAGPAPDPVAARVLVVEDDPAIAELIQLYLEQEGLGSVVAGSAEDAEDAMRREVFHLLILDINLPGRNGFQFLTRFRDRHSTPVIIVSARDSDEDKVLGLGVGADDFVTKPFSPARAAGPGADQSPLPAPRAGTVAAHRSSR